MTVAIRKIAGTDRDYLAYARHVTIRCRDSLQTGNYPHTAGFFADQIAAFPSTRSRALTPGRSARSSAWHRSVGASSGTVDRVGEVGGPVELLRQARQVLARATVG